MPRLKKVDVNIGRRTVRWCTTNLKPVRISARNVPATCGGPGATACRIRIGIRQSVETRKVAASRNSTFWTPTCAIATPLTAGPSSIPRLVVLWIAVTVRGSQSEPTNASRTCMFLRKCPRSCPGENGSCLESGEWAESMREAVGQSPEMETLCETIHTRVCRTLPVGRFSRLQALRQRRRPSQGARLRHIAPPSVDRPGQPRTGR